MKITKITLTILTTISMMIILIGSITIKSIDKTDIGMMVTFRDDTELNNNIKSINTT